MNPKATSVSSPSFRAPGYRRLIAMIALGTAFTLSGCATVETSRTVEPQRVSPVQRAYSGPHYRLAIGKFENKSNFLQGIFSDGPDRLGLQARQILTTHLGDSGRFQLLDRANLPEIERETGFSGESARISGAQLLITGAVTEFGRKETGTRGLFGLLEKSRNQIAYGKVSISVVDVATSIVLYTAQGAGEYQLTNQQVLGFGSAAGYDATLTDKVLNLAIMEAVQRLVAGLDQDAWRPPR